MVFINYEPINVYFRANQSIIFYTILLLKANKYIFGCMTNIIYIDDLFIEYCLLITLQRQILLLINYFFVTKLIFFNIIYFLLLTYDT